MNKKTIGIFSFVLSILLLSAVAVYKAEPQTTQNQTTQNQTIQNQTIQSPKMIDALNKDLENEWSSYIQYKKHSWEGEGMESPAIIELFDKMAQDDLEHIDTLGKRIVYLGGTPTKISSPILEGGDIRKMIQDDLAKENGEITQYKEHIQLAIEEGDVASRLILEQILSDEESHASTWESTLGIKR